MGRPRNLVIIIIINIIIVICISQSSSGQVGLAVSMDRWVWLFGQVGLAVWTGGSGCCVCPDRWSGCLNGQVGLAV